MELIKSIASLCFSLYRTDQRPVMEKNSVHFLYIMPEFPLYSMVTVDYMREQVKREFVLAKDFPNTTHNIFEGLPHEVAESVKSFMKKY